MQTIIREWPAQLTASALTNLSQYASSLGRTACCYALTAFPYAWTSTIGWIRGHDPCTFWIRGATCVLFPFFFCENFFTTNHESLKDLRSK